MNLKKALQTISYGMYVVTTTDEKRKNYGCVMNTLTQVTSKPFKLSFHLNKENETTKQILASSKVAISILSTKTDPNLIATFGFQSSKDVDKFAKFSYQMKEGLPVLEDASAYLIGNVIETVDMGSHITFFVEVGSGDTLQEESAMTYQYYHEVIKGKAPKSAPTYLEEEVEEDWYVCAICGYRMKGKPSDDFVCPICGASSSNFQKKN